MRDIEHPQISKAIETGYPTQEHSDYEGQQEIEHVEDHPIEDVTGTEIQSGDSCFILHNYKNAVLLADNMEVFVIEVLGGKPFTAK